jgi:gliding motility-associated protein GldM
MINMMYLVLTALLALNVAAETLKAFKIIDLSLVKTFESYTKKNISVMSDFDSQVNYGQNKQRAKEYKIKAESVHSMGDAIISLITDIKTDFADQIGAEKLKAGEKVPDEYPYIVTKNNDTMILKRQDDLNVSPLIMIERGRGEELRNKISDFKNQLISIIQNDSILKDKLDSNFYVNIEKILDVSNPEKKDKATDAKTWVQLNFDRTPLIASVTMLSKLQNDVSFAESLVLNALYSALSGESFFEAKVIPTSTYVVSGFQNFEAEIFLSAVTNVPDANVYVNGSPTPIPLVGGRAIFSQSSATIGLHPYRGEIRYNFKGNQAIAPFSGEYIVALPSATISPTRMNVLYLGLPDGNPISISVPGEMRNISATMTNGQLIPEGDHWVARPESLDGTGARTRIYVSTEIGGQMRQMAEMVFRVKRVPDPIATVAEMSDGRIRKEALDASYGVFTKMEDFDFDLTWIVTSFDMIVLGPGGTYLSFHSGSNQFTDRQREIIRDLTPGKKVSFENIKARIQGTNRDERTLASVNLTVQ